jgi:hypothetical protein
VTFLFGNLNQHYLFKVPSKQAGLRYLLTNLVSWGKIDYYKGS